MSHLEDQSLPPVRRLMAAGNDTKTTFTIEDPAEYEDGTIFDVHPGKNSTKSALPRIINSTTIQASHPDAPARLAGKSSLFKRGTNVRVSTRWVEDRSDRNSMIVTPEVGLYIDLSKVTDEDKAALDVLARKVNASGLWSAPGSDDIKGRTALYFSGKEDTIRGMKSTFDRELWEIVEKIKKAHPNWPEHIQMEHMDHTQSDLFLASLDITGSDWKAWTPGDVVPGTTIGPKGTMVVMTVDRPAGYKGGSIMVLNDGERADA